MGKQNLTYSKMDDGMVYTYDARMISQRHGFLFQAHGSGSVVCCCLVKVGLWNVDEAPLNNGLTS